MTKTAPLKSLTLSAFRGSSSTFKLDFEKNKKLSLIYGENGTGKTTICDAFEFLASGRVGSLEDRGMGKALEKYWPTAGKGAKDVAVHLETSVATCSGKIVDKKASVTPADAKPRIELLRQKQILDLIAAQPANRYDAIKRFIDIADFEQSEETLRQLVKSLTADKTKAQELEAESLSTLQSSFEIVQKPAGLNPVSWAKQKLAEPVDSLESDIQAIATLRTAFSNTAAFAARVKECEEVLGTAQTALAAAESSLAAAIAETADGAADMLGLLEAGQKYFHIHPQEDECPLCGSAENAAGLSDSIKSRLQQLATLKQANTERQKQQTSLSSAEAARKQLDIDYSKAVATFTSALSAHTWKAGVTLPAETVPPDIAGLPAWLAASAEAASSWPDLEASWRDEKKFIATLTAAVSRYDTNLARRMELTALLPKIDEALSLCVEERKTFTDGVIAEIATDVGKLYEIVHPGEGLDAIALPLDPAKRASIDLKAKFSGHDAPPQAYFSQSHLDTLGLCVFLALALRDRPAETVLILDDVLGSVDEPHVERVIGMIYEVSLQFRHTVITTHYRPWREKYRWGWLKPGQPCQFIELTGWAIDDGMRLISSLPEVERLRALLGQSPIDSQAICSKAGVILEAVLDYLTQKYECSVPRRQGAAYTLGDLLPNVSGKLREALKVEIRDGISDPAAAPASTIDLKPILDELQRIAQVRNAFGAHFKAISFELLETDAIGFAKHVVQLADALIHPEDGWPSNDKSGSYWRNSGDSRRLHPLKKPS